MLILTRRAGEKINLGNDIVVTVLEVGKGGVKIGFEAPREVTILRHEVYHSIQKENIDAARSSAGDLSSLVDIWKEKGEDHGSDKE